MLIDPYVKSRQIYRCPSDSRGRTSAGIGRERSYSLITNETSSGGASERFADRPNNYTRAGRHMSEIPEPALTLMIAEFPHKYNYLTDGQYTCVSSVSGGTNPQDDELDPVHFEGWDYLFVDGHVKWYRPQQTVGTGTLAGPKGFWTITPTGR